MCCRFIDITFDLKVMSTIQSIYNFEESQEFAEFLITNEIWICKYITTNLGPDVCCTYCTTSRTYDRSITTIFDQNCSDGPIISLTYDRSITTILIKNCRDGPIIGPGRTCVVCCTVNVIYFVTTDTL